MRTEPNVSITTAPRPAATSNATPRGSLPENVTNRTLAVSRFCNTNVNVTAIKTRAGNTRIQARPARVAGILLLV